MSIPSYGLGLEDDMRSYISHLEEELRLLRSRRVGVNKPELVKLLEKNFGGYWYDDRSRLSVGEQRKYFKESIVEVADEIISLVEGLPQTEEQS